jgi:DNA-binding GntR family transcriptional regulator
MPTRSIKSKLGAAKLRRPAGADGVTARSRVREGVRRLILKGVFPPGMRLAQQHLARRFGVAQTVVRESLLELQLSGLVEPIDNAGVFVSNLDTARLIESFEVREVLEGLAARKCCERASRNDIRELKELVERVYRLGIEQNLPRRGVLDRQFHHRMVALAGNGVLTRLTEAYHTLGMTVQAARPHEAIRDEHLAIVEAIARNDPDAADRLARAHVAAVRATIEAQVQGGDFAPQWVID